MLLFNGLRQEDGAKAFTVVNLQWLAHLETGEPQYEGKDWNSHTPHICDTLSRRNGNLCMSLVKILTTILTRRADRY